MYHRFICVLYAITESLALDIDYQSQDVFAAIGDKARLSCGVRRDSENRFSNCSWTQPSGKQLWAGPMEDRLSVYVERDQEYFYCVVEIQRYCLSYDL